jgi:ribonucleoside-diphosphate reductase alpha chain
MLESQQQEQEQRQAAAPVSGSGSKDTGNGSGSGKPVKVAAPLSLSHLSVTGNLCPKCGCNTMVHEEGCRKCYSCGHSEC